jgi:predicted lipoprotein with Yx(FWY)xxD motif
MRKLVKGSLAARVRVVFGIAAGGAGFATAVLVGAAWAASFTLGVAAHASVKNQSGAVTHESIVVTKAGRAVYELSGDSRQHPKCTKGNGCFKFWPPATVNAGAKLTLPSGVKGKLATWKRNGLIQLTLGGHPLYRFSGDSSSDSATGQGITGFGGTWSVVAIGSSSTPSGGTSSTQTNPYPYDSGTSSTPTSSTPTSTTPTYTTPTYTYPTTSTTTPTTTAPW